MDWEIVPPGLLGGKLAHDLISPSLKAIGAKAASYTKKGIAAMERVMTSANALSKRRRIQGDYPLKVVTETLRHAYFCEDELQSGYLGGILASSRGRPSRDDRAASYLAILASLSSYQIRTHAILYSSVLRIPQENFTRGRKYISMGYITVILLEKSYRKAMAFRQGERAGPIVQHAFTGLRTKNLVEEGHRTPAFGKPGRLGGGPNLFETEEQPAGTRYRYFYPTALGIELFLWGVGYGDQGVSKYSPELMKKIKMPVRVIPVQVVYGKVTYAVDD